VATRFDFDNEIPVSRSTFVQGRESLVIHRIASRIFVITFSGTIPQLMQFPSPHEGLLFCNSLESELTRTGWTLTDFTSTNVDGRAARLMSGVTPAVGAESK